jgi:2-octaprenyl-6-methoxyphenol hydroxylase
LNGALLYTPTRMKKTEVILIGAGMAGLSLAALLAQRNIAVTVIDREDPRTMATEAFDARTVALSVGTRNILAPLDIWKVLEPTGTAITTIDVQEEHHPFVLNFDAAETDSEAFGWIFSNSAVRGALYKKAKENGVIFIQDGLKTVEQDEITVTAVLQSGTEISAPLLIGADGRHSRVRALLGFDTVQLDYKQTALVGLIEHEKPHHGLALERFYPAGPFAALPFVTHQGKHHSAIVWTRHKTKNARVPSLDELTQLMAPMLDERYGAIKAVGTWAAFPLSLCHAKEFIAERVALISDAAHAMHPIAGQGLNVGMRDVNALVKLLGDAKEKNTDLGSMDILKAYQRARRFDVMKMMAATDLLNRLFNNSIAPVRWARSAGLGLVDRVPPLKRFFAKTAMGR